MNSKNKAQELYDKFVYQICNDNGISLNDSIENCAKACSILTIDEIISDYKHSYAGRAAIVNFQQVKIMYWEEVKKEIQKL